MPKPASSDRPNENPTTKLKEESHQTTGAHNNLNRQTPMLQSNPINKTRPKRDPKEDQLFPLVSRLPIKRRKTKQNKTTQVSESLIFSKNNNSNEQNNTGRNESHMYDSLSQ